MSYAYDVRIMGVPLVRSVVTFSMPPEMAASLNCFVQAGEYSSTSEIMREALREWSRSRTAPAAVAARETERDPAA
jgi:Arc/MetJ-type ribon-helix-helix transcriptional regulator